MSKLTPFPFKLNSLNEEEKQERVKFYKNPTTVAGADALKTEPGDIILPKAFEEIADEIYNMELRPDDVWVVTYPKCGTTWTQEMVWQIIHNVDKEGGKAPLNLRVPFLEIQSIMAKPGRVPPPMRANFEKNRVLDSVAYTKSLASPRCIKSHLPLNMLPPKLLDTCKVIFVSRDPKDVLVSMFNHDTMTPSLGFEGTFPEFAELYKTGKVMYGDYWYHLDQALKHKYHPNLKILWYEDMKKDLQSIIKDTAGFLGKHLTELKVLELDDHLYFDNFKKNPAVNYEAMSNKETGQTFMRKGKVGDWKNHFSGEGSEDLKRWVEQKKQQYNIDVNF